MIRWVLFLSSPSFEIAGASGSTTPPPRWDRVDSRRLIALARRIYFRFLTDSGHQLEPMGVVVNERIDEGRVVFEHNPALIYPLIYNNTHRFKLMPRVS